MNYRVIYGAFAVIIKLLLKAGRADPPLKVEAEAIIRDCESLAKQHIGSRVDGE